MNLDDVIKLTKDENIELEETKAESSIINAVGESLMDKLQVEKDLDKGKENTESTVLEKTINSVTNTLEENIAKEVEKLNLNESVWKKISKSAFSDVVKVAIEAVLKGALKKKFGINFSTFNEMKDTLESVMNGDLKEAIKTSSDAAVDSLKVLDGITRSTIKTVKNAVIDKTIDSEKYEIVNKQTKLLNRISDNCEKFNEALDKGDEKTMKSKVNSIKKDMKEILPIRETINRAQSVLDKYSLWQNKGNTALSTDESELIDKLNNCA